MIHLNKPELHIFLFYIVNLQFYHAFGTLKNTSGYQYSHVKELYNTTPGTPVGGFGAIVVEYAPK